MEYRVVSVRVKVRILTSFQSWAFVRAGEVSETSEGALERREAAEEERMLSEGVGSGM